MFLLSGTFINCVYSLGSQPVFLLNYILHLGVLPLGEWGFLKGLMCLMCPLMVPNTETCAIHPDKFVLEWTYFLVSRSPSRALLFKRCLCVAALLLTVSEHFLADEPNLHWPVRTCMACKCRCRSGASRRKPSSRVPSGSLESRKEVIGFTLSNRATLFREAPWLSPGNNETASIWFQSPSTTQIWECLQKQGQECVTGSARIQRPVDRTRSSSSAVLCCLLIAQLKSTPRDCSQQPCRLCTMLPPPSLLSTTLLSSRLFLQRLLLLIWLLGHQGPPASATPWAGRCFSVDLFAANSPPWVPAWFLCQQKSLHHTSFSYTTFATQVHCVSSPLVMGIWLAFPGPKWEVEASGPRSCSYGS